MMDLSTFKSINPISSTNPYDKESFDVFLPKAKLFLPNFPDDVIEHWVYRHFGDFCNKYWFLDYATFHFYKIYITNDEVLEIKSKIIETMDFWGDDFINNPEFRQQTWLGKSITEDRTWPQPIIVLDTLHGINTGLQDFGKPLHLLEGHLRLSYVRALTRHGLCPAKKHPVWKVVRVRNKRL